MGKAWAINADTGAPEYAANELRRIAAMYLYPGVSDQFGARQGVRPHSTAVVTVSGTTWTQHDVTAVVYPGLTSASGPYVVEKGAESAALNPADGSNPRLDGLDLQVRDDDEDASGFRDVRVVYVPGTPAGAPSAPPVSDNSLRLATILVPAGGTPSPSVATLAPFTVAAGGILPVRDATDLPLSGRHVGMYADQADEEALKRWDGSAWGTVGNSQGYQFGGRVIYTSSGTFSPGDHPGLRAVDVTVIGGGGGSGGVAACGAGESAEAGGGQGGSGAKKFLDAASLFISGTVTVGAGGNGASVGNNPGSVGGTSSFSVNLGANIVAPGGSAGAGGAASGSNAVAAGGSTGAVPTGGDINIVGDAGGNGVVRGETIRANFGGGSAFGMGPLELTFAPSSTGSNGNNYGGGAAGPRNNDGDAAQGGQPGAGGIVIVELYF